MLNSLNLRCRCEAYHIKMGRINKQNIGARQTRHVLHLKCWLTTLNSLPPSKFWSPLSSCQVIHNHLHYCEGGLSSTHGVAQCITRHFPGIFLPAREPTGRLRSCQPAQKQTRANVPVLAFTSVKYFRFNQRCCLRTQGTRGGKSNVCPWFWEGQKKKKGKPLYVDGV